MRKFIVNLSPRSEFVLVIGIAFAYPILGAWMRVARGRSEVHISDVDLGTLCLFEISALILIGVILRIRGWEPRALPVTASARETGWGLVVLLVGIAGYWISAALVAMLIGNTEFLWRVTFTSTATQPFVLLTSLINPLFEESIVVGYVASALRAEGVLFVVGCSTLIRLSYHVYQGPLAAVSIVPLGIVFAGFYCVRPNLWPLFVGHGLGDLLGLLART